MFEYAAFNPFNASPEGLAAELTRKSAEGWEVVSITTKSDGRFCAFLRRPVAQRAASAATSSTSPLASDAGYATAAATTAPAAAGTQGGSATTPAVPAAWYKDPSGRFEMRYWNGTAWTEHVARGGQQFTDPPVA
ncbi:MAG: DUF2510 domain-containing protein [Actinomycetota bacterium]